jgi:hypothetical protein
MAVIRLPAWERTWMSARRDQTWFLGLVGGCGSGSGGFVLFGRLRGRGILLIWLVSGGEWFLGCGRGEFRDRIGCGGEVVLALQSVDSRVLELRRGCLTHSEEVGGVLPADFEGGGCER